jgi:hypothetical protein
MTRATSRVLKKANSPQRHRVTESQRLEGFRTYQKCQQMRTLLFSSFSVSPCLCGYAWFFISLLGTSE